MPRHALIARLIRTERQPTVRVQDGQGAGQCCRAHRCRHPTRGNRCHASSSSDLASRRYRAGAVLLPGPGMVDNLRLFRKRSRDFLCVVRAYSKARRLPPFLQGRNMKKITRLIPGLAFVVTTTGLSLIAQTPAAQTPAAQTPTAQPPAGQPPQTAQPPAGRGAAAGAPTRTRPSMPASTGRSSRRSCRSSPPRS